MTDQELKDLVASIAVAQARNEERFRETEEMFRETDKRFQETDKRFQKLEERFRQTDEKFQEVYELIKKTDERLQRTDEKLQKTYEQLQRTDEQLKKTDEQLKRTDEQLRKTDEQLQRTDEQLKRTDEQLQRTDEQLKITDEQVRRTSEKVDRIASLVGNISNNQGDATEEYFINSLEECLKVGEIDFDFLIPNFKAKIGRKVLAEYDILLVNRTSVAIVEVKYKAHLNDLEKLPKKIQELNNLPQYRNYKVYAGIATFYASDELIQKAKDQGYFILQRRGDVIVTHTQHLKAA